MPGVGCNGCLCDGRLLVLWFERLRIRASISSRDTEVSYMPRSFPRLFTVFRDIRQLQHQNQQPCPRTLTESQDLEHARNTLNILIDNSPIEARQQQEPISRSHCLTTARAHHTAGSIQLICCMFFLRGYIRRFVPYLDGKIWPHTTRRLEDLYHIAQPTTTWVPHQSPITLGQYFSSLLLYTSLPSTYCDMFCLVHHSLHHCMAFHLVVSPSTSDHHLLPSTDDGASATTS